MKGGVYRMLTVIKLDEKRVKEINTRICNSLKK